MQTRRKKWSKKVERKEQRWKGLANGGGGFNLQFGGAALKQTKVSVVIFSYDLILAHNIFYLHVSEKKEGEGEEEGQEGSRFGKRCSKRHSSCRHSSSNSSRLVGVGLAVGRRRYVLDSWHVVAEAESAAMASTTYFIHVK